MEEQTQKSYADLLREITQNAKDLVSSEIDLIKTEAKSAFQKVASHSVGLGIGSWLLIVSPVAIFVSVVLLLGEYLNGQYWLSALIVGLSGMIVGGVLTKIAVKKISDIDAMSVTKKSLEKVSKRTKQDAQDLSLAIKGSNP